MEIVERDLPQLIVALDSLNDDANYVHILDAKENTNYYCPCCKGIVKPRAYKKDKNYQVQAHYYHETGGCNEETFVHYICKTWLFEKGCKFIVNDTQYEVENIEVEKTLHTSFGDYRPDIIVTTTVGKVFYFEIKTTNKKTELYAPKWDELGNDVVEVDTRYFINQKYKNDIPVFNLIYSDGECFIKSYSRNEYEDIIAKRKLEWKRQDKLNYKIKWEQLDWFWEYLQDYYAENCNIDVVCNQFSKLDFSDQKFICSKLNSTKHKKLKYELENYYNNKEELQKVHLQHISAIVRKLNCEFGYSSCDEFDDTYLCRKNNHIIFRDNSNWEKRSHLEINDKTTENDVYNYFYPIMEKYYKKHTLPLKEKRKQMVLKYEQEVKYSKEYLVPILDEIKCRVNKSKNNMWGLRYNSFDWASRGVGYKIHIYLDKYWSKDLYIYVCDYINNDIETNTSTIQNQITNLMRQILGIAKNSNCASYRIMEMNLEDN